MAAPDKKPQKSPLISGGIFSASKAPRANARVKEQPSFQEILNDYHGLLDDLRRAFSEAVDNTFPNADFLASQPGSHISEDTKLSVVVRVCYGLSQMNLSADLVKNYQRTITEYMKTIQHDPSKKQEYTELRNILFTYQSLAVAVKNERLIQGELGRLMNLELPAKTIDRRLRTEWVGPCILQPTAELTDHVAKAMRSTETLQTDKLAGASNSLAGLSRSIEASSAGKKRHPEAFAENTPGTMHR